MDLPLPGLRDHGSQRDGGGDAVRRADGPPGDRIFYRLQISYAGQIHFWRVAVWVIPLLVFGLTYSVCRSLARSGSHPLGSWQGVALRRKPDGSLELVDTSADRDVPADTEPPAGTMPGREYPTPHAEAWERGRKPPP